jgi:hypothetical protein
VWLFPWSAFIWGLVRAFPRSRKPAERTERVCLLLFLWIGVILAFYTFGATQEYYTFPTLAAFALLLGKAMADLDAQKGTSKWGVTGLAVMAALTTLAGVAMIALTWRADRSDQAYNLSTTLTTNPECYRLAFGHISDLTAATFRLLAPLVCRTATLLIVGPIVALLFALWKRWMVSFLFLAAMMIGLCHYYDRGMVAFEPVLSSKNLAGVVQYYYRPGDMIAINDFYEKGSTLNYYTGQQVYVMNGRFGVLWYGLQDPDASKLSLTDDELIKDWTSAKRIFFFSEKAPLDSFLSRHPDFKYRLLAQDGGKKILINW